MIRTRQLTFEHPSLVPTAGCVRLETGGSFGRAQPAHRRWGASGAWGRASKLRQACCHGEIAFRVRVRGRDATNRRAPYAMRKVRVARLTNFSPFT